jgi:hypothetical protein
LGKSLRTDLTPRAARREALAAQVRRLFRTHRGTYGSPRITADLREAGWKVSEDTVADDVFCYGTTTVHPSALTTAMLRTVPVREYQVRQTARGADITVVADPGLDEAALAAAVQDSSRRELRRLWRTSHDRQPRAYDLGWTWSSPGTAHPGTGQCVSQARAAARRRDR